MVDILESPVDIERHVAESREILSPDTKKFIVNEGLRYIEQDLNPRAARAIRERGSGESYIELAATQRDLALCINTIRSLDKDNSEYKKVSSLLLDPGKPTSMANNVDRLKIPGKSARQFILGPVSALTLYDMAKSVNDESPPSMDDVLGNPKLDAFSGLDFIQYAGVGRDGKTYVNLVQIKTITEGPVDIMEIDGEHEDYLGVSANSAHKLSNLAQELNDAESGDRVFRAFVVLVPAYDSPRINNVYGKIRDNSVLAEFQEASMRTSYMVGGPQND